MGFALTTWTVAFLALASIGLVLVLLGAWAERRQQLRAKQQQTEARKAWEAGRGPTLARDRSND